jgi:HK97 family phage portal protein
MIDTLATRVASRVKATSTIDRRLTDPVLARAVGWTDELDTEGTQVSKPYKQAAAVYACISVKARNIAQVPFKIYRLTGKPKHTLPLHQKMAWLSKAADEHEITDGPPVRLFADPNPTISKYQLWETLVMNLDLYGEWFLYESDETRSGGMPLYLHTYPATSYDPAMRNGEWFGWWLTINNEKRFVAHDQLIYDKYTNPYDMIRGLSPLEAYRLTLEGDVNARRYNRNFYKNDGTPPVVYMTEQPLSDDQYRRLRADIIDTRQGVDRAHRAQLLDSGLKAERIGLSQKDMEFLSQIKLGLDEACMVFGVPKWVVSNEEGTNYATALSADRGFWMRTLLPLMQRIEDKVNSSLLNQFGYEGAFDVRQVDAINYAFLEKVDAAEKLYKLGFTANEINERLDLGFESEPWRDEPYAPPAGPMQLSAQEAQRKGEMPSAEVVEKIRGQKWRDTVEQLNPTTSKLKKDLRTYFHDVEQKVLRKIIKGYRTSAAVVIKDQNPDDVADAFNDEKLRSIVEAIIRIAGDIGMRSIKAELRFDTLDEMVRARLAKRAEKVTVVNETAREQVQESIRLVVEEAAEEGWSEQKTTDTLIERLRGEFKQIERRARTIARTEVHGAFSEGRHLAMEQTKPRYKMWISSRDSRVRDSHRALDGEKIVFGERFKNGLAFPLDPDGAAGEVINCRCIEYPIYSEDEEI